MAKKRLVLNFPPQLIDQPVTYRLITQYQLEVNILRASITPREWGRLVVEVTGSKENLDSGLKFASNLGVEIKPLAQDVQWYQERCIECTACTAICPTGALQLSREEMRVSFDHDKCIVCGLCLPICPYGAVEIMF
ncbi:MAG: 4Fe-4S binding protein [Deltaproteobacteria bacterium]|nr:4Fe-4S binding protein [Deltaproteobacteria bacterium]MBW2070889.1 4Fe-4S binding protein [Deltaproteobacteria bacterium]